MPSKKIMIIGASLLQLPAIVKAKELGCFVIAVDGDRNAVGFQYADESLNISTIDVESILAAATEKKIDGIMTLATDMPVRAVAAVTESLKLKGISRDTANLATNKFMMRERLKLKGIPIPRFYKIKNKEELYFSMSHFNDFFIVKPVDNSGSRGVYLVKSKNELEKAFYYAKRYSRNGDILIEEFLRGPEVSVETISLDGYVHVLAITDKITTGSPYFVEMGHSQPAKFDDSTIHNIELIASRAILALGIENGPSHTEIILTEEGPKIVEIGARLGGDFITSHLVPLSTGIDMVECCIKLAINEKPDLVAKFNMASAIRFINSNEGRIQSVSGVENALAVKGMMEVRFIKQIGHLVNNVQNSGDRIGFVIAQSESVTKAINACEKALSCINIEIAKESYL